MLIQPTLKYFKDLILLFLLSLTTFCSAQDKYDTTDLPLGLFFREFTLFGNYAIGHEMFELKKCSKVILWHDDQGLPFSELGIWSLKGDTLTMYFDQRNLTFVWKKGPDKDPNFYSSLQMVGVLWTYRKVSKDIFAQKLFVKTFAIKGKAVCKNGMPMLKWNHSPSTYIRVDKLLKWDKKYYKKKILIWGVLEEGNDGSMILKDFNIISNE